MARFKLTRQYPGCYSGVGKVKNKFAEDVKLSACIRREDDFDTNSDWYLEVSESDVDGNWFNELHTRSDGLFPTYRLARATLATIISNL